MATPNNLVVKITAVDAASGAIDALARKLGGITAPAQKVGKSLARLSDASGVTRLSKAIVHLGGTTVKAGTRMTEALAPLGILTGALSAAGAGKMVADWARMSQALSFDATRIGSGISQLHALEGSARLSGSSAQAASSGLRTLQDTMTDTVGGRNMEALVYFRQLKVAFDDGAGHALRAADVLPKLADGLKTISDRSLRARVGTALLGGAYEELAPWIDRGSKGMAEYAELARHYGVQTEEGARAAGVFRVAQGRLALAFEGLGNSISEKVSPPLSNMMTFLAELVNKWRPAISDTFGEWAKNAGVWVKSIDWPATISYIEEMATKFKNLMDSISKYTPPPWMQWVLRQFGSASAPAPTGQGETPTGTAAPSRPTHYEPEHAGVLNWIDRQLGRDVPRGIRNNNPLNLSYAPGQGATGSDGRFGVYGTMEDGVAAATRQLALYQDRDHLDTIRGIISKWAPPSENDTEGYIKRVSDVLHLDPDQHLDLHDPNTSAALVETMAQHETGRMLPMDVVQRGVNQSGVVKVDVTLKGLPPGATATATTSGDATGGVKIARAMP